MVLIVAMLLTNNQRFVTLFSSFAKAEDESSVVGSVKDAKIARKKRVGEEEMNEKVMEYFLENRSIIGLTEDIIIYGKSSTLKQVDTGAEEQYG